MPYRSKYDKRFLGCNSIGFKNDSLRTNFSKGTRNHIIIKTVQGAILAKGKTYVSSKNQCCKNPDQVAGQT